MSLRYLIGPVTAEFAQQYLEADRRAGYCLAFHPSEALDIQLGEEEDWEQVEQRLPAGWQPDLLVLYLPYNAIPARIWQAPIPILGLAADWNLLWHLYLHAVLRCDCVLTDVAGVCAFRGAGFDHVRQANLYGLGTSLAGRQWDQGRRDIDILFVGNLQPAVQQERLAWLARVAQLAYRWKVVIRQGVFGDEYAQLLNRSRIVFNRSIRGEANKRAFEALAAGALLFQEADNLELPPHLRDRDECVYYDDANLESLLEFYLENEAERIRIAAAGHRRAADFTFERLWQQQLQEIEGMWPGLLSKSSRRRSIGVMPCSAHSFWEALSGGATRSVGVFAGTMREATDRATSEYARGQLRCLENRFKEGEEAFRRAYSTDPTHVLAGAALGQMLAAGGQVDAGLSILREALRKLELDRDESRPMWRQPPYPCGFASLRVNWEKAAWQNPGSLAREVQAKADLLSAHLHNLVALWTGDTRSAYEAAVLNPADAGIRQSLGVLLRQEKAYGEVVRHLRRAQHANPFDREVTRQYFTALGEAGLGNEQRRLADENRNLHAAAPQVVPAESWLEHVPEAPDALVSIIILCCNEVAYTRLCLESVLRHSRRPFELILVDNASTDDTSAFIAEIAVQSGPQRVVVLRNDVNVGFPAGCNQGLAKARGRFLVFLNNDTIVTPSWLDGLVTAALTDWPGVGAVGAVSNYVPAPQLVQPAYRNLAEIPGFALQRRRQFTGQSLTVERLSGFCMLLRRDVVNRVGSFDERFGLGFFDDDDLGIRVRQAGFRLRVALDVYVHHFGSRTFHGLGIDCPAQLAANFESFKAKWGEEYAAGYHLPDAKMDDMAPNGQPQQSPQHGVDEDPHLRHSPPFRISLAMIVKNEEHNLPACLESVRDLVDEMVIVDTGSQDETKQIAEVFGAKVTTFDWVDSFAEARNESVRQSTGDWIFWMDADDRLDETNRARLGSLFERLRKGLPGTEEVDINPPSPFDAFVMTCRCVSSKEDATITDVQHVRLFRNHPNMHWEHRIHEQILPAVRRMGGTPRFSDVVIHHVGYQDAAIRLRKRERDLRLLLQEVNEKPDHPFTLFNLGMTYLDMRQSEKALPLLRRSLHCSASTDSIVRKLHYMIVQCYRQMGQNDDALAACQKGRSEYPQDAELLAQEGLLLNERDDLAGAEQCYLQLLNDREAPHFASVPVGLNGYLTRHNLAVVYLRQQRPADAEVQWRAALKEKPEFESPWLGLEDLFVKQCRWEELERLACEMENQPTLRGQAEIARARGHLGKLEFRAARKMLRDMIAREPRALRPRVLLSHVLLQEDRDQAAAQQSLEDILALDPHNHEAKQNLNVLRANATEAHPN